VHSNDEPDEYNPDNAKFFSGWIFTFVTSSKFFDGILMMMIMMIVNIDG
jgi:hypothetical protein